MLSNSKNIPHGVSVFFPARCKDDNDNCPLAAADGLCIKARAAMEKYCKKSCNICTPAVGKLTHFGTSFLAIYKSKQLTVCFIKFIV